MRWRKNLIVLILLLGVMSLGALAADWWAYRQMMALAAVQGASVLEGFTPFDFTDGVWGIVLVAFVSAIKELVDLPGNGHAGHAPAPPELAELVDKMDSALAEKEMENDRTNP